MDKITPTVIVALVIGLAIGFLVKGMTTPTQDSNLDIEQMSPSPASSAEPGSKEGKIAQALAAGPDSLAKNATVLDFPASEGSQMVELKKGSNDWTCLPDYPTSPGNDPMCLDKQGMVWMDSYFKKQAPNLTQAGLAYMLQGGSDASNTDPFAEKPTEGDDWITSPSHTMVFPVGKLDQFVYSTDPKNGGPWIMWAGTPFEHLMIPVK